MRTHCNSLRLILNQGNNTNITNNAKSHLDMCYILFKPEQFRFGPIQFLGVTNFDKVSIKVFDCLTPNQSPQTRRNDVTA